MQYGQALNVLDRSGLSPERAARELGVSGMTLRRWRSKPKNAPLPEIYRAAIEPLAHRLVGDGILNPEDPAAAAACARPQEPFQKTLQELGITLQALESPGKSRGIVAKGLARIGENENRQDQVKSSGRMLERLKAMGAEWSSRIGDLTLVMKSNEITALDKLVAFGALFYLICPFDLIPDAIPVIGYADDFIILGIAVLYYRKRFPHLFPDRARKPEKRTGTF